MTDRTTRAASPRWALGALAVIVLATATPQAGPGGGPDFFAPLPADRAEAFRDVAQNVLLYIPFGLLLGLRAGAMATVAAAAGLALGIECLQFVLPGRYPVVLDVLTNACGGAVGWALSAAVGRRRIEARLIALEGLIGAALAPSPGVASVLSFGWAVCACALIAATYGLQRPALPPQPFFGVVSPEVDAIPGPARIGGGGFAGLIDEVRVYRRALTAEEIASDMERPVSQTPAPDLVAARGFDAGAEPEPQSGSLVNEGRFGRALSLDGGPVGEALSALSDAPRGALTFEAWVRPDSPSRGEAAVVSLAGDAFYLRASSDVGALVPSAGGRFGAVPRSVRIRRHIPVGRWSHLASTFDTRTIRIFVNGQLAAMREHWSSHRPVAASLDGRSLSFGAVSDPVAFRQSLEGPFELRATIDCGPVAATAAPILLVSGLQSVDAFSLLAAGDELQMRYQTWARRLGLDSPNYRMPGALSTCRPGRQLSLVVHGPLAAPRLEVEAGTVGGAVSPGPGSLWAVAVDSQALPAWLVVVVSSGWLAALVLPFGYWSRRAWSTAVGAVLLTGGLTLLPQRLGTRGPEGLDWLAVAVGLSAGVVASAVRRRSD